MARLRNITVLTPHSFETPNIVQLMYGFIFNNTSLEKYDSIKTYVKGDYIINFNTSTKSFDILCCKVNSTTGMYDAEAWEVMNNRDVYKNNIKELGDVLIQASETQPTHPDNKVWYRILNSKIIGGIGDPVAELNTVLLFSASQFIAQDDVPENNPDVVLWFDLEP